MIAWTPRTAAWGRYLAMMSRTLIPFLCGLALGIASDARAQVTGTEYLNAVRDSARAQERQAESLRQIERIERDQARDADRARRNAARDARSARRFDHPR